MKIDELSANFFYAEMLYFLKINLKPRIMEARLESLKNYERMEAAMLDQSVLKENNIDSSIQHSTAADILPMFGEINEGISLLVFEQDTDKAREVLKEYHQVETDDL